MKRMIWIAAVFAFSSGSHAQTTPEAYLDVIPALPKSCCQVKASDKDAYLTKVNDLVSKLDQDIRQRKKEAKGYAETNKDKVASEMMSRAGVEGAPSPKKSKMTREERKAMADQVMQQYGVSAEDTKKLKKMTQEEKTAWAQNYAGAASAKVTSEQSRNTQAQGQSLYDLQMEQKALVEKINTRKAGYAKRVETLNREAQQLKAKEIDPLQRELTSMSGIVTGQQEVRMDALGRKLKAAQKRYCEAYAPQYLTILREYLADVKVLLPDYDRLETIAAKVQMGLEKAAAPNAGLMSIQAILDYTAHLQKVFKYDLLGEQ